MEMPRDKDVARMLLDAFDAEIASTDFTDVPSALIIRAEQALYQALTHAAGNADDPRWGRFYREARTLVSWIERERNDPRALPWLRAFLRENADLRWVA
jgi:hypothetical protein